MKELVHHNMSANSTRGATYEVRLLEVREGFVVETIRGAGNRVAGREMYWRPTDKEALALCTSILHKKTGTKRERVYKKIEQIEEQYDLFGASQR